MLKSSSVALVTSRAEAWYQAFVEASGSRGIDASRSRSRAARRLTDGHRRMVQDSQAIAVALYLHCNVGLTLEGTAERMREMGGAFVRTPKQVFHIIQRAKRLAGYGVYDAAL